MSLFGHAAHDRFRVGVAVALRACRFDHAQRRVVAHAIGADHDLVRVAGRLHVADERPHARTLRAASPLRPCRAGWSLWSRVALRSLLSWRPCHDLAFGPRRPGRPCVALWTRQADGARIALRSLLSWRPRCARIAFGAFGPRRPGRPCVALWTRQADGARVALRSLLSWRLR